MLQFSFFFSFQLSDDIEVRKNGYSHFEFNGRAETSTLDKIEQFIESHDVTVNVPFIGTKVTVSPKNLNTDELLFNVKFAEQKGSNGDGKNLKQLSVFK